MFYLWWTVPAFPLLERRGGLSKCTLLTGRPDLPAWAGSVKSAARSGRGKAALAALSLSAAWPRVGNQRSRPQMRAGTSPDGRGGRSLDPAWLAQSGGLWQARAGRPQDSN